MLPVVTLAMANHAGLAKARQIIFLHYTGISTFLYASNAVKKSCSWKDSFTTPIPIPGYIPHGNPKESLSEMATIVFAYIF
ncbi:UNVERIFIED_CONTAM: hypothetical protein FKN15_036620 [Acipenser sinensis]